jgi:hypothetical protein
MVVMVTDEMELEASLNTNQLRTEYSIEMTNRDDSDTTDVQLEEQKEE